MRKSGVSSCGKSELTVPTPSAADVAHALVKGVLAEVPGIGGPLAEMFQTFFGPPIEKRREDWMRRVATVLTTLLAKGLTVESLQNDDRFISAVVQTTLIAQRTHQQDKLNALRNALINIGIGQDADEALHSVFLSYVDAFTVWHLKLLAFFQTTPDSRVEFEATEVLLQTFPELKDRPELVDAIVSDLTSRDLLNLGNMSGSSRIVGRMLTPKHTTPLGDRFLKFIADPADFRSKSVV